MLLLLLFLSSEDNTFWLTFFIGLFPIFPLRAHDQQACAFTSYSGGFNQDYRANLIYQQFIPDLQERDIPVTEGLDICEFMVDQATQGEWNMQGLPTDPLSVQNGVLVTNARRYPLMIDPQGQAITWITNMEKDRMPAFGVVQLDDNRLKEKLEFAMAEGQALVVAGVNEEIDPMLDPVLEKQIVRKGKTLFINVADQFLEYNPKFSLYFISRLPQPALFARAAGQNHCHRLYRHDEGARGAATRTCDLERAICARGAAQRGDCNGYIEYEESSVA